MSNAMVRCDKCNAEHLPGKHLKDAVPSRPARDGETLSDETLARWRDCFGHPCAYAHVIIPLLDEVAALRAQLADARADNRRVSLIQEYCFARNISWRGLIDDLAARAASGEDASNQQTGRARSEESDRG